MTVNYGAKYGEWIAIDNDPENEDTYLVAWLPKGLKRKECFVALLFYDHDNGWALDNLKEQRDWFGGKEIELFAWTPLPEMYKII